MGTVLKIPFLQPNPARLSELGAELLAVEDSGIFSNYGPVNTRFEMELTDTRFGGIGGCMTVCNATIGLMLAIRHAVGRNAARRPYVMMPSFTFAATAHAALWCGLTPLLYDIDPDTWLPCADAEAALLAEHGDRIACMVPYATFGNCLDMEYYDRLSERHGIPVVVDAASSLGSVDALGRGFGTGSRHSVVFSMHATKTFAVGEAGVIYNADPDQLAAMRAMGNFGFTEPRTARLPGLNSKLSEVTALQALAKLAEFPSVVAHRAALAAEYDHGLPGWTFQRMTGISHAYQFMPVVIPGCYAGSRDDLLAELRHHGVGAASYFSPHLAEQPYFGETCVMAPLPCTERVASRIIALPMSDALTQEHVRLICALLRNLVPLATPVWAGAEAVPSVAAVGGDD